LGILCATLASAQFVNPIKAAKDAYAKAKQQQNAQAPSPQSQPASTIATASNQSAAEPWTPPAESANPTTPVLSDPLAFPEVPKMPDVIGVHLGMNPQEALDILHKQYPSDRFQEIPGVLVPFGKRPNAGFNVIMPDPLGTQDAILTLTAPPTKQVVWRITRYNRHMHVSHDTLMATLREKYGKESAVLTTGGATTDPRQVGQMFWLFDERGNRAPLPGYQSFAYHGTIVDCFLSEKPPVGPITPSDDESIMGSPGWCDSFVGVRVTFPAGDIVETATVDMLDVPLAMRTAHAYVAWKRDANQKAHQAELEKSKKAHPVF
jgi:hypothetical protein